MTANPFPPLLAAAFLVAAAAFPLEAQGSCCFSATNPCCAQEDVAPRTTEVALPCVGLGSENESAFAEALIGIGRPIYECAGHPEATSAAPGGCAECGGAELAERLIPAIQSIGVEIDGMQQRALLELTPGETLRLSSIRAALADASVTPDLDRMALTDGARLHIAGMTCSACSNKLSAALAATGGVSEVTLASLSAEDSIAKPRFASPTGMRYAALEAAIEGCGFRLTDVSWTRAAEGDAPPPPRYEVGIMGLEKRLSPAGSQLIASSIAPGSPADEAGMQAGDSLVKINGHVAFEFTRDEFRELFGSPEPIAFEIERNGEILELTVVPRAPTSGGVSGEKKSVREQRPEESDSPRVGVQVGDLAPEIDGVDLDGVPFKLSDYRGKVTVLTYWGFW